jgi:predicted 2-oxoglutarate/Fe(II)-dependent dioxygenase YbiX
MKYTEVSDYIHVTRIIPEDLCKEIIEENNSKKWQKHTWYNPQTNNSSSEKTKELDVLVNDKFHKKLTPHIIKSIKEYNEKYAYLDTERTSFIVTKFCPIRFNRYRPGQIMRKHHDHIYSIFDGIEKGIPVLSIIGNLNEDYEGGELVFFDGETKLKLGTGDICIFPSCFMYPHEVYEVTEGERNSFVTWAW